MLKSALLQNLDYCGYANDVLMDKIKFMTKGQRREEELPSLLTHTADTHHFRIIEFQCQYFEQGDHN